MTLRRPAALKLHEPVEDTGPDLGVVSWLINGYPAEVRFWSSESFARLHRPPVEAQQSSGGIWAVLVIL